MLKNIIDTILLCVDVGIIVYLINDILKDRKKNEIKELCNSIIDKLNDMLDICNDIQEICKNSNDKSTKILKSEETLEKERKALEDDGYTYDYTVAGIYDAYKKNNSPCKLLYFYEDGEE